MTIIFFDVDGVLIHGIHSRLPYRKCWDENLEQDFGISRIDFLHTFIRGIFVEQVLVGQCDLYSALQSVLPGLGYEGDPQLFIDYWMKNDANLNHALIPHIQTLSALPNVVLYIATNQEPVRATYLMEVAGFKNYFQDIFYSARLGCLKPQIQFFIKAQMLVASDQTEKLILFDDSPDVVSGARNAGWEAHQFVNTNDLFKSEIVAGLLSH